MKIVPDQPEREELQRFVSTLLEQRPGELEFVVLFGSRARGDWSAGSDYDLLIGLSGDDGKRLIDRMAAFVPQEGLEVEVFPYSRSEWERMFHAYHPLFLEALESGIVLWDQGTFAVLHKRFSQWRREGRVQPWRAGWKISDPTSFLSA